MVDAVNSLAISVPSTDVASVSGKCIIWNVHNLCQGKVSPGSQAFSSSFLWLILKRQKQASKQTNSYIPKYIKEVLTEGFASGCTQTPGAAIGFSSPSLMPWRQRWRLRKGCTTLRHTVAAKERNEDRPRTSCQILWKSGGGGLFGEIRECDCSFRLSLLRGPSFQVPGACYKNSRVRRRRWWSTNMLSFGATRLVCSYCLFWVVHLWERNWFFCGR